MEISCVARLYDFQLEFQQPPQNIHRFLYLCLRALDCIQIRMDTHHASLNFQMDEARKLHVRTKEARCVKTKVITIISGTSHSAAFEAAAKYLDHEKFDLLFIFLHTEIGSLQTRLQKNFKTIFIRYSGKRNLIKAMLRIFFILFKERPQVVHTHLFDASLIGLFAAKLAGIKKRVYTRHHSNSNQVYAPDAVKYDLFINRLSTDIISISKNVTEHLIQFEKVDPKKIVLVYHGIDFEEVSGISDARIFALREKYKIPIGVQVVGVISRYIHLKGLQYIIPAFQQLLKLYPDAILVLANARGSYANEVKKLLVDISSNNYREIEFEPDLYALYRLFSVFVHVPIDARCEAFGQTYIEALASGVPSVFTLSGVAPEFISNGKNALVVPFKHINALFEALKTLLEDEPLGFRMAEQGMTDVRERFNINKTIRNLEALYLA